MLGYLNDEYWQGARVSLIKIDGKIYANVDVEEHKGEFLVTLSNHPIEEEGGPRWWGPGRSNHGKTDQV